MYSDGHLCVFFLFISFNKILIFFLAFLCQCPTGYYGAQCENRNYCMPNPCNNNGLCLETATGYICRCNAPYTGTNCQLSIVMNIFDSSTVHYFSDNNNNNHYHHYHHNDYNNHHNDHCNSYCDTSTVWFRLRMYCHTMSDHYSDKSMYTKSMVRF